MVHGEIKTAKYKIIADAGGSRYRFFCEASGAAVCTTGPIKADTQTKELSLAWEQEGKKHFNRCGKCGRFVCDTMYNADVCECVDCAPWEKTPHYCKTCGRSIAIGNTFCSKCGKRAMYGEVWA